MSQIHANRLRPLHLAGAMIAMTLLVISMPLMAEDSGDESFELLILDVTAATHDATLILGRVESGSVSVGDTVCVPVYGEGPTAVKVEALQHETAKVETAEKGWRAELYVKGVETDKINNDGRVTSDC